MTDNTPWGGASDQPDTGPEDRSDDSSAPDSRPEHGRRAAGSQPPPGRSAHDQPTQTWVAPAARGQSPQSHRPAGDAPLSGAPP